MRAARKLAQTLDREPSSEDVAEMLDRPLESVKRMFGLNERATSVDAPVGREAERPLLDTIADEHNIDPSVLLQNDDVREHIDSWLQQLTEKQRAVVELRFGLHDKEAGYAGRCRRTTGSDAGAGQTDTDRGAETPAANPETGGFLPGCIVVIQPQRAQRTLSFRV